MKAPVSTLRWRNSACDGRAAAQFGLQPISAFTRAIQEIGTGSRSRWSIRRELFGAIELLQFFGVQRDFSNELPPELYPTDLAPFIRLVNGARAAEPGRFGLLPPWRREVKYGRNTYNARNETIDRLPS